MRAQGLISFILLSTLILAGPALGQARITDGQQVLYGFEEEGGATVEALAHAHEGPAGVGNVDGNLAFVLELTQGHGAVMTPT